ncbi:hypothetical protein VNO78_12698 [Psophocarpus tetragonolobus]|uniref:O-methyltransferase domain-containing protein n=1 Tax=Psophocarpus tetragonolobus TaxID=3891 RepID=A0AAN9SRD4_PSOTE
MGSIGNIVEENNDACISALQVCFGPVYSAVLNATIELNLFDIIAKTSSPFGVSASDIASQLQNSTLNSHVGLIACCVYLSLTLFLRIKQLGGNMFEGVPKGGDAIMLKVVLHNWSDEQCLKILRNCYNALPQNGKLILVETIMSEEIHSTEAAKVVVGSDNIMLDGGLEKTQKEFESLCKRSGFSDFQVVGSVLYGIGVMEFRK